MKLLIKNFVKFIRYSLISVYRIYFVYFYGMNIDPTAKFSLKVNFDKTFPKGVYIGSESYVAFGATILTHDMTRNIHTNTYIGKRCFIGAHSIIMPGISVGDMSIVGAGSVVTRDVPPQSIVAGNPARIIKSNIRSYKYGCLIDYFNEP